MGCVRTTAFLLMALAAARASEAAEPEPPSAAAVVVSAAPGAPPWIAEALELHIERELDGYQRVRALDVRDLARPSCGEDDTECAVARYREAGADIVFAGVVDGPTLRYSLYETWTPARVARGSIDVGPGTGLIALQQQTLRAFRPLLRHGGLLDQKRHLTGERAALFSGPLFPNSNARAPSRRGAAAILLVAVAIGLALPIAAGALLLRRRRSRLVRLPAVWLTTALVAAALIAALALALTSGPGGAAPLIGAGWRWLAGIGSGLAWGALLVDSARFVFPPLHGLERAGHRDIFRLLTQWALACAQRAALLVAYYAPFAVALSWVAERLALSPGDVAMVAAPVTGLLARHWISAWVACLAPWVDDRIASGDASRENPWHGEIHRYFMGYVRRSGWSVDHRALSRIVFLPGATGGVISYGGAGSPGRIVIDEALLELAAGTLEEALPEQSDVPWPQWAAGVVPPGQAAVPRAANGPQRPGEADISGVRRRGRRDRRRHVGQAATLLGYVVPAPPGELVPLIADDIADLEAVRELLSEHYAWFAPDPDEEDDDSDPTDKDLLFGALAREIGVIERRDHERATLALAATLLADRFAVTRALAAGIRALWHTAASRYPAIVADAYAALHFARDPLIQYLAWRHGGKTDSLTARASPERLRRTSVRILEAAARRPPRGLDGLFSRASLANRIRWLSHFFPEPIPEPQQRWVRRAMAAGAAAAAVIAAGSAVDRAIDYHPVYVERIAEQERARAEAQREKAQQQPIENGRDDPTRLEPIDDDEEQTNE